ncbi:MAG: hypothetical protein HOL01_00660 [Planctomycetaceae bacterium]|jgi:hypothetical protein|nr:hypothetical protein [Planctomycetaceae bacterium]MBT6487311.1 hypothetical protein [Planctomycetaceae bacterium]MBT6493035.1 hypothetical protein [Planctomycetaceae bacterium]
MPNSFSGPQLILLGLAIVVIGFLLRRSFTLGKKSRERDPAAEVRAEMRAAEQAAESGIRKMEVRLYDYGREVEGRVQTTLTLLNRLILEADEETGRLHELLLTAGQVDETATAAEGVPSVTAPLTADEQRMVRDLKGAGYTVPQISRLLRRPVDDVTAVISDSDDSDETGRTDAA